MAFTADTHGHLPELIDIMIEFKIKLFVCAVGVPPPWLIEKLHANGIPVMNMIGSPRNAEKAMDAGVDILCAQGTEGGGHTGDIATSVLLPMVVDIAMGRKAPLNGMQIPVVAAGGISDGRGLAMALTTGAAAVWVGTRFIASTESAAPSRHQQAVIDATPLDTCRTLVYSGRPLRTYKTDYVVSWMGGSRDEECRNLCAKGIIPFNHDLKTWEKEGKEVSFAKLYPLLMGQAAGTVKAIQPAVEIVEDMVKSACEAMQRGTSMIVGHAKM